MTDRAEIERLLNQTGRTPEEIKIGLSCSGSKGNAKCEECAYCMGQFGDEDCNYECDQIDNDALALIERLESERDAALEKVPKWISVKERLPEEAGKYIVCTRKKAVYCTAFRCFYDKGYFATDSTTHITHWMYMPEPPKECE